jgi:hypothetical protein
MFDGFCATDKRSAITARHACRPKRSREAAKRPGYVVLAPPAPELTDEAVCWFGPKEQRGGILTGRPELTDEAVCWFGCHIPGLHPAPARTGADR